MADRDNLRLIAAGNALRSEVENDLEERGLIVQTDQPYATLTDLGKRIAGLKRTILIHLNVEVPTADERPAKEIADAILGAIEVGSDDDSVRGLRVEMPLAEEV